jgi:hypothetical protein
MLGQESQKKKDIVGIRRNLVYLWGHNCNLHLQT